jgi:hypothetical protein
MLSLLLSYKLLCFLTVVFLLSSYRQAYRHILQFKHETMIRNNGIVSSHLKFLVVVKIMTMRKPAELAGARGWPFLCDRSPSTASGAPARPEGAPDSGGVARGAKGAAQGGGWPTGELGLSSAPRGPPPLLRPPLLEARLLCSGLLSWRARLLSWRHHLLCSRRRPAGGEARPAPA